jgi:hypothetical protein
VTRLVYGWVCLACGEEGMGDDSNKAAEKHTVKMKHATRAFAINTEAMDAGVRGVQDGAGEGQGEPVPEE